MNKVKIYDKHNRLTNSFSFMFAFFSFYKYEGESVHKISISNHGISYSITKGDEYNSLQITKTSIERLVIEKTDGKSNFNEIYNLQNDSVFSTVSEELEEGKKVSVNTFIDSKGKKTKEILFDINEELINKLKQNG